MDAHKLTDASHTQPPRGRWRRAVVTSSVVFGLIVSGVAVMPTVVNQTQLRNQFLNTAFQQYGLKGSAGAAKGSWLQPVSYERIEITDANGRVRCTIGSIRTSKTLLELLSSGSDLGTITLVNPVVEIDLDEEGRFPLAQPNIPSTQTVNIAIEDGEFRLSVPWRELPIVDLDDLNLSGRIENREGSRWLVVDEAQIFDHERLSEAHAEQNLALIAPVLSQTTAITGEVSVWMDKSEICLDAEEGGFSPFPIQGRAKFHTVNARLKPWWVSQINQLVRQLNIANVSDRIEIVRDSDIQFDVTETGIRHSGLAIVLPQASDQLSIDSSGFVNLDETLDLTMSIKVPKLPAGDSPFLGMLSKLVGAPISLHIAGTVSEPRLIMPPGMTVLNDVSQRLAPEQHTEQPPTVSQAVFKLIGSARQSREENVRRDLPGSILGLIRAVAAEKEAAEQQPEQKAAEKAESEKPDVEPEAEQAE